MLVQRLWWGNVGEWHPSMGAPTPSDWPTVESATLPRVGEREEIAMRIERDEKGEGLHHIGY